MPNALQGLLADPRGEMRATPRNKLMEAAQGVSKGFWADGIGGPVRVIDPEAEERRLIRMLQEIARG